MRKLDRLKPFGYIGVNPTGVFYTQDGIEFNCKGNEIIKAPEPETEESKQVKSEESIKTMSLQKPKTVPYRKRTKPRQ